MNFTQSDRHLRVTTPLGPDALLMYRWVVDGNRFALASKSGGHVR